MRWLFSLVVLAVAQIGAAYAVSEMNVARPGGAFSTVEAEDAAACERQCADDTLCMAWSFRDNLCELKAIVPAAIAQTGTISGVSARAPAPLRSWTPQRGAQSAEEYAVAPPSEAASEPIASETEDDITAMLLGGPEDTSAR